LAASRPFTLENGRVRLADALFVYLERTLAPSQPLPPEVSPRSYGLSPSWIPPAGSVIAACAPGEAVWLGFQAVNPASPVIVRVRADSPQELDAVTGERWEEGLQNQPRNYLVCPPDSRLVGVRHPAGFVPFGVDATRGGSQVTQRFSVLSYGESDASVGVELVSPETFTSVTGLLPEPLDPDSAYKGWRLP
jgi:hypothetical protein